MSDNFWDGFEDHPVEPIEEIELKDPPTARSPFDALLDELGVTQSMLRCIPESKPAGI